MGFKHKAVRKILSGAASQGTVPLWEAVAVIKRRHVNLFPALCSHVDIISYDMCAEAQGSGWRYGTILINASADESGTGCPLMFYARDSQRSWKVLNIIG